MKDYAIWCTEKVIKELYNGDMDAWDEATDRVMTGEFTNKYSLRAYMEETGIGKE